MDLFIFHRDLRIEDNTSLINCILTNGNCTPIFIFTPEQIDDNKYFSERAYNFMVESLYELKEKIKQLKGKLYFFKGDNIKVLKEIHKHNKINSISFNLDYSPYAKERDNSIIEWCQNTGIKTNINEDYSLYPVIGSKQYKVFTPFKNYCLKNYKVRKPNYIVPEFKLANIKNKYSVSINGKANHREEAVAIMEKYKSGPSHLSAYIHFGLISIREVYYKIKDERVRSELHWRDFYYNMVYHNENLLGGMVGKTNKPNKEEIKWSYNKTKFKLWCDGMTGFPIVDAFMRQLNSDGTMDNRGRMIVASFLCKDLHIDWRMGEQYFATKLKDYDPISNNQGWMWVASVGTDASPWFRIFNPWIQSVKFDPDCNYIKKWVPEVSKFDCKRIHRWDKYHDDKYKPMLDHDIEKTKALKLYKAIN